MIMGWEKLLPERERYEEDIIDWAEIKNGGRGLGFDLQVRWFTF
jgi:hypothetical protein